MTIEGGFAALSLRDLLEAREAYHVHLLRQRNVVATAVGRYLLRADEDDPGSPRERLALRPGERAPRRLEHVRVSERSWPCVIVFVERWMSAKEIAEAPDEMVPRRLYLPDGRIVPTCVVCAGTVDEPAHVEAVQQIALPSGLLGGGYGCLSERQGRERVGSIGCLVSDGVTTYALTNRHVAGTPGTELHTRVDGATVPIGRGATRSARRMPFEQVYPGLPGSRMEVAIDAGLIELNDLDDWTTQVFGVGQLSQMRDLGPEALTLELIGTPVRAFGAASGTLNGQVLALFHRFTARSGVEYVADAVIAPRAGAGPLGTRPGDSGTLWVVDSGEPPQRAVGAAAPPVEPLALQWGAARFAGERPGTIAPYALVTFLSTACRALDVEPVLEWNTGYELYWGDIGHYTIGARACELVEPVELRAFFVANREQISFDLQTIAAGKVRTPRGSLFYPLADVPDMLFRSLRHDRAHEGPNHFADVDEPLDGEHGPTLLSLFADDESSLAPQAWIDFYERLDKPPSEMGLVPFRVAQLYRLIVDSLKADDVDAALTAAGLMAHYLGDCCQPLHTSRFHDGRTPAEEGVHSRYETDMVRVHRGDLIAGLDSALAGARPAALIRGHEAAAREAVRLMQRTVRRLPPKRICDVYARSPSSDDMWEKLGARTVACIADGCVTLAGLWSSAWAEVGADAPPARARNRDRLAVLYRDPDFARSYYLTELVDVLPWTAAAAVPVP
jgi:hypothetical protein